jgi:hypothetical protein
MGVVWKEESSEAFLHLCRMRLMLRRLAGLRLYNIFSIGYMSIQPKSDIRIE